MLRSSLRLRGGVSDVDDLSKRVTALGALIRAGVKPESASATVGLSEMDFYPGRPVTIREESSGVES